MSCLSSWWVGRSSVVPVPPATHLSILSLLSACSGMWRGGRLCTGLGCVGIFGIRTSPQAQGGAERKTANIHWGWRPGGLQRPMFSLLPVSRKHGPSCCPASAETAASPAYSQRPLRATEAAPPGPVRRQGVAGGSICRKRQLCQLCPLPHPPPPLTGLMRCLALGFFPLFTKGP